MRMLNSGSDIESMRGLLEHEDRPASVLRPWVMANMVTALDGSVTRGGHAKDLSGAADQAHFHALREIADVILVGANTVRIESYRKPELPADIRSARLAAGRHQDPTLVVVSRNAHDVPGGFE